MSGKKLDYSGLEVTDVELFNGGSGVTIKWDAPHVGFGELTIWGGSDGKLHADTECMSNEFVALVLSKLPEFMVVEG